MNIPPKYITIFCGTTIIVLSMIFHIKNGSPFLYVAKEAVEVETGVDIDPFIECVNKLSEEPRK